MTSRRKSVQTYRSHKIHFADSLLADGCIMLIADFNATKINVVKMTCHLLFSRVTITFVSKRAHHRFKRHVIERRMIKQRVYHATNAQLPKKHACRHIVSLRRSTDSVQFTHVQDDKLPGRQGYHTLQPTHIIEYSFLNVFKHGYSATVSRGNTHTVRCFGDDK